MLVSSLLIAVLVVNGAGVFADAPVDTACGRIGGAMFGCPDRSGVTMTGSQTTSTDDWDPTPGGNGPLIEGAGSDDLWFPEPPPPVNIYDTCRDDVHEFQSCLNGIRVDAPTTQEPTTPPPAVPGWSVTISDLARFVPSTATVAGEPDNIAVVGLPPANFLSSAKTETIPPGTILGRSLTIRFTPPVSYAFDYGDGGTAHEHHARRRVGHERSSAVHAHRHEPRLHGARHVHGDRHGHLHCDVDLGAGWIPISGTLNGPPASQQIRVVKAYTALVQGTCLERPQRPPAADRGRSSVRGRR